MRRNIRSDIIACADESLQPFSFHSGVVRLRQRKATSLCDIYRCRAANNCVQAGPGCALMFFVAQVSGTPDAERAVNLRPNLRRHTTPQLSVQPFHSIKPSGVSSIKVENFPFSATAL